MEWYEDDWKFESLEEMAEYCRAYGEEIPDEFEININGKREYFKLSVIGKYKLGERIRVYESKGYGEYKYIKFIYYYECFYYELREFIYIDENEKEHDIFDKLEGSVDDKKIDKIYEQIEAINPIITRIK